MIHCDDLIDHNDNHIASLSNENLRQAISTVMADTEEDKHDAKRNANNVTMDNFCQSLVTTNTQGKIVNVPNER